MEISVNKEIIRLINTIETPAIVYDADIIKYFINKLRQDTLNIPNLEICFAVKANRNPLVLKVMREANLGADIASIEELNVAIEAGLFPIYCTSPGFSHEQIENIYNHSIIFDFDNLSQLKNWLFKSSLKNRKIGLRIRPYLDKKYTDDITVGEKSRFGINPASEELHEIIKNNNLLVEQLHVHIGEKKNSLVFKELLNYIETIINTFDNFKDIKKINLGGGYDHLYANASEVRNSWDAVEEFSENISRRLNRDIKIIIEPGSLLTNASGFLYSEVKASDELSPECQRIILDSSAFNLLSWAKPKILLSTSKSAEKIIHKIYGPTCFEYDYFFSPALNKLGIDDRILMHPVGAYVSGINRNLHGLQNPKEYLLISNN